MNETLLFNPAYTFHPPLNEACNIVFNSPHSGSIYPQLFLEKCQLPEILLRESEDVGVNKLIFGALDQGIAVLEAHFPRIFLDVNREPYELDGKMFQDDMPSYINKNSVKVRNGLGTIPRKAQNSQDIYKEKLTLKEGLARIDLYYRGYHRALREVLRARQQRFGEVLLVDWHSMPSSAVDYLGVDIVLGDRFGTSCSSDYINFIEEFFIDTGLKVERNHPFAGGFITQHYGQPNSGFHALQIEIKKGLYLNEENFELLPRFVELKKIISMLSEKLSEYFGQSMQYAAE